MQEQSVSRQTLKRLPLYINYLKALPCEAVNVSATSIAAGLGLNDVQVRKDLAAVSSGGRPKTGYVKEGLLADIQRFLGYDDKDTAVIVGMGNLGRALRNYSGFKECGLDIVAAFDVGADSLSIKDTVCSVLPVEKLTGLCRRLGVKIGIITVPAAQAESVCKLLVSGGVKAIWNFAPVHIKAPEGVLVHNENMAASVAILSKHTKTYAAQSNERAGGIKNERISEI